MKLPPIPKPLLIVIVVIVILGVVSCGAGVFRGLNEGDQPSASDAGAGFKGVLNGPVKAEDIRGDCSVDVQQSQITVNSSCQLRLEPVALLPRVLKIEINSSSADPGVDVTVSQEIDGKIQSPDTKTISSNSSQAPDFEVSAAGSSPVFVTLSCSSCVLDVVN